MTGVQTCALPISTFRIERLRLRIANLLKREGLGGLEVILFNPRRVAWSRWPSEFAGGQSLRYAVPPQNRAEFSARGIRVRKEESFRAETAT